MKQKLLILTLVFFCLLARFAHAQITAADEGGCILDGDSWSPAGSVAGHNTYQTVLSSGGAPCKVQWSVSNNRWEIIAAVEADGLFNDLLYFNNTNTATNPPALSVGGWTDSGFGCGPLATFQGPYTSTSAPAPAPTVTSVTSSTANGIYKIGSVISIQISFSEAVTVAGTPQLSLETGATDRVINYTSGSGTSTLSFNYTVQSGDNATDLDYTSTTALALNGGTIKNASNANAVLTLHAPGTANSLGANKNIIIDGVAPVVTDTNISISGASGIGGAYKIGDVVTATWNNTASGDNNTDITSVTVNFSQFGGGTAVVETNSSNTWTASYTITAGMINATNRNISVTATDNAGNVTTTADVTNVTADNIAPTITGVVVPGDGAYGAGSDLTFQVVFSENIVVDANGGTPRLALILGSSTVYAENISGSVPNRLLFTYTVKNGDLDLNGITVGALTTNGGTIKDAVGNDAVLTLNNVQSTANVLVDGVAPTTTATSVSLSNDSGVSSSDLITNVAAQTISGTLSANLTPGEQVFVSLTGGIYYAATATTGSNTFSIPLTLAGSSAIYVYVRDAVGNIGTIFSQPYTLDTTAPTTTVAIAALSADSGPSATDFITNVSAQIISGTLSTNLAVGEMVLISIDNGGSYAVATAAVGSNSWSKSGITLSGSNTLKVVIEDLAGNRGSTFSQSYTLDTTAPTTTISSTAGASGAATSTSPVPFTVTFSESVSGFSEAGVNVSGGTIENLSGSGNTYTFNVIPSANGTITVNIGAGVAQDFAGNNNAATSQFSINYQSVLPVSLIAFTAKAEGNAAKLEWSTASESNNNSFIIMRSHNGTDFVELTKINGQGTTQNKSSYFYHDKLPLKGENYYKLLQQDINGTTTELGLRVLSFTIEAKPELTLAPNPAINDINIYFPQGTYRIEIIDASGQLVQKAPIATSATSYLYAVTNMKDGLYIVRSFGNYGTLTTKLIKQ